MKRIIAAVIILLGFGIAWQMLAVTKLKVVGQPSSTGILATQVEQPFFATLQKETGLPIEVNFKTLDTLGIKDTYQLPMMKEGIFDLVSLRLIQNSKNEVSLNGLDITRLNLDFKKGRMLADAYMPVVDKHLQDKYQVKVLGLWTFGPQEIFCKKPIQRISDLRGIKSGSLVNYWLNILLQLGLSQRLFPLTILRRLFKISWWIVPLPVLHLLARLDGLNTFNITFRLHLTRGLMHMELPYLNGIR